MRSRFRLLSAWGACVAFLMLLQPCTAQKSEVLREALQRPPASWSEELKAEVERHLEWEQKQLESMHAKFAQARDAIKKELDEISVKIEHLQASLPAELQFSTAETRAQLATHAAQLILNTRLDLAVGQEKLEVTEVAEPIIDRQAIEQKEFELQIAERELEVAQVEYDESVAASNTGLAPKMGLRRAEAGLDNLKLKLHKLRAELDELRMGNTSQQATRVTELRMEQRPLKARLEVAETFLKTMRDSGEQVRRIGQLERERDLMMRDLEWVASQLAPISRELMELQNIKELIGQEQAK